MMPAFRRVALAGGLLSLALAAPAAAQGFGGRQPNAFPTSDSTLRRMWTLGMDSSHTYAQAQALMDSIGPRLNGSPGHKAGNEWLVSMYKRYGIPARNEQYGTWKTWRRGVTHMDLVQPRVRSLEATLLAWSSGTKGRVEGKVVTLPAATDSAAFRAWLPQAKGAFVLVSFPEPTCRPDSSYREYATPERFAEMQAERNAARQAWTARMRPLGSANDLHARLAQAGVRGILTSNWSRGWGVNKIFSTRVEGTPVADVSCEDYGLLHRLAERNQGPVIRLEADAQMMGEMPVFNTIAEIRGSEKPDEYVMLSAHFDSWDGGSGATDNGTGTVVMLEAMRILKAAYPNPKRTILVGHWGGEEQGLNGSRAFAADHPEIVKGLAVLLNQDNGTGRVSNISMGGMTDAAPAFARWMGMIPSDISRHISLNIPGMPGGGGSDYASFLCYGAPSFSLSSNSWEYGTYTWHTNRDTFDKIDFGEIRNNATLTAMLAYLASESPEPIGRTKRVMPSDSTGQARPWPACTAPARKSSESSR